MELLTLTRNYSQQAWREKKEKKLLAKITISRWTKYVSESFSATLCSKTAKSPSPPHFIACFASKIMYQVNFASLEKPQKDFENINLNTNHFRFLAQNAKAFQIVWRFFLLFVIFFCFVFLPHPPSLLVVFTIKYSCRGLFLLIWLVGQTLSEMHKYHLWKASKHKYIRIREYRYVTDPISSIF